MSSLRLIRWGGLAALLSGALLLVSDVLEFFVLDLGYFGATPDSGIYVVVAGLFLLATLLASLGLVGLYAGQVEASGSIGLLGFLLAYAGTVLVSGVFWAQALFVPLLTEAAPESLYYEGTARWLDFGFVGSFSLFALGWLLFGVATLRARIYPRWAAVLLMVGVVLVVLRLPVTSAVFDTALAWLGFWLFAKKEQSS